MQNVICLLVEVVERMLLLKLTSAASLAIAAPVNLLTGLVALIISRVSNVLRLCVAVEMKGNENEVN